ncbi:lytic polysaccharide monooxygenase [Streptomyces sp. NPDC020096]
MHHVGHFHREQITRQPFWKCPYPDNPTRHTITLPERQGCHVILAVWEIADTGNAYYQSSTSTSARQPSLAPGPIRQARHQILRLAPPFPAARAGGPRYRNPRRRHADVRLRRPAIGRRDCRCSPRSSALCRVPAGGAWTASPAPPKASAPGPATTARLSTRGGPGPVG